MNLNKIINEEINNFVNSLINEDSKQAKTNAKARVDARKQANIKRMGTQNNASDRQKAANIVNDKMTNNYEIARQMFANGENGNYSSVDSLASALRKKAKHLPGANGGHLHLYQKEANAVNHTQSEKS